MSKPINLKHVGWSISHQLTMMRLFFVWYLVYLVYCKATPEKVFSTLANWKGVPPRLFLCLYLYNLNVFVFYWTYLLFPEYISIFLNIFSFSWIYLNVFSHVLNFHRIILEKDVQQWLIKEKVRKTPKNSLFSKRKQKPKERAWLLKVSI